MSTSLVNVRPESATTTWQLPMVVGMTVYCTHEPAPSFAAHFAVTPLHARSLTVTSVT